MKKESEKPREKKEFFYTSIDGKELRITATTSCFGETHGRDIFGNHPIADRLHEISFSGPTGTITLPDLLEDSKILKKCNVDIPREFLAWGASVNDAGEMTVDTLRNPLTIATLLHEFGHVNQNKEVYFAQLLKWYAPETKPDGIILPVIIARIMEDTGYQSTEDETHALAELEAIRRPIHKKEKALGHGENIDELLLGSDPELDELYKQRHLLLWKRLSRLLFAARNILEADANKRAKLWLVVLGKRIGIDFEHTQWSIEIPKDWVLTPSFVENIKKYQADHSRISFFEWLDCSEKSHNDVGSMVLELRAKKLGI